MLDIWKTLTVDQLHAALSTLCRCIEECPDTAWDAPVANIYNIRHVQHHAAQLSLRLRLDAGADIPWARSGWR